MKSVIERRAKAVGDSVGHVHHPHREPPLCVQGCGGCVAEKAASRELIGLLMEWVASETAFERRQHAVDGEDPAEFRERIRSAQAKALGEEDPRG